MGIPSNLGACAKFSRATRSSRFSRADRKKFEKKIEQRDPKYIGTYQVKLKHTFFGAHNFRGSCAVAHLALAQGQPLFFPPR